MDARHSNRRSGSSQGGNNKPAHLPTSLHITTGQRSNSVSSQSSFFRTSTPSFHFDNGQPFFGGGKANAGAATSTPVESQGAAFRFGEADVRGDEDDDRRTRARSREPYAGPRLSTSIEEGAGTADESSFWNPGAARKARTQGATGNGGGLFGFAASAKSAPLFGQGLPFGQNGGSKQDGSRSGSMSAGSGGFFTPVNAQNGIETPDAAAAPATSKFINGRQAPAAKRSINQIDESAPDDSFHFQPQAQQRRQQQGTISNGLTGQISGDVEEILIDDAENGLQNGASLAAVAARPTYARKNSHLMMEKLGRGINGNHTPLDTSIAGGNFAAKANRIVSNPREKKRSRAGPSNFDDASTTTASSSHSVDTNGALYHASSSSSSSPPAGQSENDPHGYALPSIAGRQTASGESHSARPVTTPAFHRSTPAMSAIANLAASQPLLPAPSAEREMSYKKQLEAAQNALAENWLRSIFRLFAKAQSCMSKYECSEAIKAVLSLPKEQRNSTRAILLLGEASFESLEYAKVWEFTWSYPSL